MSQLPLCQGMVISIHALRTEGDAACAVAQRQLLRISIHALRTEGDRLAALAQHGPDIISIHALRTEGDGTWKEWPPKR